MARDNKHEYEVLEFYGNVRGKEDNWGITLTRMKWDENPPTVNIRNTNLMKGIVGKGVSLTDEETNAVVDILLNNDFGSIEAIESALERRRSLTSYGVIEADFEVLEE